MPVAHSATRDQAEAWDKGGQVGVNDPFCCQMPRGRPWPVFLLTVKDEAASSAVVSTTIDSELRKRDRKASVTTPALSPYKKSQSRQETVQKNLKNCEKDAEV